MAQLEFNDFAGLADSIFRGIKGSFYKLVGLDIHSVPGSITVHQKLAKNSGSTVTEFCRYSVSCSTGWQIWFSYTSGKIWARSSAGAWTLAYTTTPAAGNAGCLGAEEYNGNVYFATQSRLHYIAVANVDGDWTGSVTEDFGTFSKTDSEFHPMRVANAKLFIGDGNIVASVDSSNTFTASALDLEEPSRIKCIENYDIDILLGTIITNTVNYCSVVRWDTVQTSWQYEDHIDENGVNAFFKIGNTVVAQCGTSGNIYYYDGTNFQEFKRIPGTWTPTRYGEVYPDAVGVLRGISVFGFSNSPDAANSTGNPADQGVYSLGHYSKDYPIVLTGPDWIISQDLVASIEIGSILVEGHDMYVSWKDGSNFGVDKIDYSNKYASAYLETPAITPNTYDESTFPRFFANYQSLPASCSLTFSYKVNHGSYVALTTVDDVKKFQLYADGAPDGRVVQLKVQFTVSSNSAPVVESIGVELAQFK